MKYTLPQKALMELETDGLVIPVFEKEEWQTLQLPEELKTVVQKLAIAPGDFKGEKFQIMTLPVQNRLPNLKRIFLIGLGEQKSYSWSVVRDGFGKLARHLKKLPLRTVAVVICRALVLEDDWTRVGQTLVEGMELGSYEFTEYKKASEQGKDAGLQKVMFTSFPTEHRREVRRGVRDGGVITEAVKLARDLGNHPANVVTPKMLAKTARSLAATWNLQCEVFTEKEMHQQGMNALLAVAKGSVQPPRFIVLRYQGTGKGKKPVVVVGKGVTFDSGGISLKPGKKMDEMKFDMSGGGAVLGILQAAAALKLPVNVVGLIPAVENLPGGNATKPGDIITSLSGTTIEVLNTDAEGRLILADALAYAEKFKPGFVVNLATLTGAVVVAIGHVTAGIMGNDEPLLAELKKWGQISGERVWPFPLYDEYKEQIKSEVADIKNIGEDGGGVVTGGAFLSRFAEHYKWAHIDIAGVAWTTKELPTAAKGATGFGVRLLVEWLRSLDRKGKSGN